MHISLNRGTMILEGLIFLALGILAAVMPVMTAFSLVVLIGGVCIIIGIIQFLRVLRNSETVFFVSGSVSATLAIIIGVLMLVYPIEGVLTIALLVGIWFMFHGIIQIGFSIQARNRSDHWGLLMLAGIISIILSFIMWSGLPLKAAWMLGLLLGINLMFYGGALVAFAIKLREESSITEKNQNT